MSLNHTGTKQELESRTQKVDDVGGVMALGQPTAELKEQQRKFIKMVNDASRELDAAKKRLREIIGRTAASALEGGGENPAEGRARLQCIGQVFPARPPG